MLDKLFEVKEEVARTEEILVLLDRALHGTPAELAGPEGHRLKGQTVR